ncbi:MAG: DNA replication/repair protein RecF [Muribaculaceae bacterium]|nr:DNA replication/repair protein RecF [Muribaculaceae bacterium]
MVLEHISILNFKNIAEARLDFSSGVNCLIGNNGQGKTNVLDAIHYLSYCRCFAGVNDSGVIRHGEPFMMLQGHYRRHGNEEDITLSYQRGKRKVVKRNEKEYKRLSQHIGLLPLVMISPMDWDLIRGAGEERRRLMDQIISQGDKEYLDALIRYNKALEQRNSMIRHEMTDPLLFETVERALDEHASLIHTRRAEWVEQFLPIFMNYYGAIAGGGEKVRLGYKTHLEGGKSMLQLLNENRQRDIAIGYTTRGVHRDDIELWLDGHSMRRVGSQGQCKTYTIALRLAQFEFLKQRTSTTPILLLDDIFDKLDASRVENIMAVVSQPEGPFGQIFITDTNRTHLDHIVARTGDAGYAMMHVEGGVVTQQEKTS